MFHKAPTSQPVDHSRIPGLIQDNDAIAFQQGILKGFPEERLIRHEAKQGITRSAVLEALPS